MQWISGLFTCTGSVQHGFILRVRFIHTLRSTFSCRRSASRNPAPLRRVQMASVTAVKHNVPSLFSARRIITLLSSVLVALGSGTNYVRLGARLHISHTQLNIVGLAGNAGVSVSGPIWGRIVDFRGPQIPLVGAFVFSLVGYAGLKRMYDEGADSETSISSAHFLLLMVCSLLTGLGAHAGVVAAVNTTARSFPESARATTTGLVLSGFGLSAFFFSTIARILFPGDTSALLLLLSLATSIPMLVALFTMRPVPLPQTYPAPKDDVNGEYELLPSEVEPSTAVPDVDTVSVAGDSCVPLADIQPENGLSSTSQMGYNHSHLGPDNLPDVHGKMLWSTPDFYLLCVILSLHINNVGLISLALFAEANPNYEEEEASKLQAAQVSTLSVGNFVGRILIGLISDFTRSKYNLPRAYSLCIVSSLFIISQAFAIGISNVGTLWMATAFLGFAYGSLFGALPAITIDWFGLAHLSENLGYLSLAPLIGGNVFSIIFGRNIDAHTPREDMNTSRGVTRATNTADGAVLRDVLSERRCFAGQECYVSSLKVTLMACMVALILSTWAARRDKHRRKARKGSG
ncbi:major facilitator superfamily domain-containing protein [Pisolithus thermaeus]|nr:major facilitator superfamily domain-containing protein [Pisolithus thermaeus]